MASATLVVWLFIRIVRKASDVECEREKKDVGVPPWITGTFERLLAFGLLYVGVEEAGAILAGWIAAKLSGRYMGRRGSCGEHTKRNKKGPGFGEPGLGWVRTWRGPSTNPMSKLPRAANVPNKTEKSDAPLTGWASCRLVLGIRVSWGFCGLARR